MDGSLARLSGWHNPSLKCLQVRAVLDADCVCVVNCYTVPFYLHDWFEGLQLLYYPASKSLWSNLKCAWPSLCNPDRYSVFIS